jgi:hypothetical protein
VDLSRDQSNSRRGDVFADKGYVSTGVVSRFAKNAAQLWRNEGVILDIRAPKGTRYLRGRSDEAEVLLIRDSRFVVECVGRDDPVEGMLYAPCSLVAEPLKADGQDETVIEDQLS